MPRYASSIDVARLAGVSQSSVSYPDASGAQPIPPSGIRGGVQGGATHIFVFVVFTPTMGPPHPHAGMPYVVQSSSVLQATSAGVKAHA